MVWRKQSDTTLVLRNGCLGVWKNWQVVQRGWSNDLSLPRVYNPLSFSSAKSEALWIKQLVLHWALWADNLWWWPRWSSTLLLYTAKQHQKLSWAKLQPILIKGQIDIMCFPTSHWVEEKIPLLLWFLKGILSRKCIPEQACGGNSVSSILSEVKIPFFVFVLTVSLFSTTLKDKVKTLHEHLETCNFFPFTFPFVLLSYFISDSLGSQLCPILCLINSLRLDIIRTFHSTCSCSTRDGIQGT